MGERGAGVLRCPLGEKCAYTTQPGENNDDTKALGEKCFRTTAFLAQMRAGACLEGACGVTAPLWALWEGATMRLWVLSGRMNAFLAQGFRINAVFAQGARMKAVFARNARMSAFFAQGACCVARWLMFARGTSSAQGFVDGEAVSALAFSSALFSHGGSYGHAPVLLHPPHGSGHFSRAPRRLRALDRRWAWDQAGSMLWDGSVRVDGRPVPGSSTPGRSFERGSRLWPAACGS